MSSFFFCTDKRNQSAISSNSSLRTSSCGYLNVWRMSGALFSRSNGSFVSVTGRTRHSGYEAAGVPRYGMDMIADGFAVLAKANGKPTHDTGG
jgi:hypothetical protein